MKRRARSTFAVAMLAVLVPGVIVYASSARSGPDRQFESAPVSATGTLSALVSVQVGSQVSGRIQAILVDFSSPVKKGQVIAQIDRQMFQAAVEQARGNRVAANCWRAT
jgi:HlyD family secretion protein